MEYIRGRYNVPAKVGGRVKYTDTRGIAYLGTIVGSDGAYLSIKLDGDEYPKNFHPTWNMEYLQPITP